MTNKKKLSERDICTQFILPAVVKAGWDVEKQVREEVFFTDVVFLSKAIRPHAAKENVLILFSISSRIFPSQSLKQRIIAILWARGYNRRYNTRRFLTCLWHLAQTVMVLFSTTAQDFRGKLKKSCR